jgi:hypothetical protein
VIWTASRHAPHEICTCPNPNPGEPWHCASAAKFRQALDAADDRPGDPYGPHEQARRSLTMPSPQRTARLGVLVAERTGLSRETAIAAVSVAAVGARLVCRRDGHDDTPWLDALIAEVTSIRDHHDSRRAPLSRRADAPATELAPAPER